MARTGRHGDVDEGVDTARVDGGVEDKKKAEKDVPWAYRHEPTSMSSSDKVTRFLYKFEETAAGGDVKADDLGKAFTEAFTAHVGEDPRIGKAEKAEKLKAER